MERASVKFTEEYIKGIINGLLVANVGILPSGYELVVNNYDGMNNVLLKPNVNANTAEVINLTIIQGIRSAIQRIFSEECDVKVKIGGVLFSIIERDVY